MRKDCINRELTLEWIVGTFMFLILLALAYFTIIIGSDNLFRRTYPMVVVFDDVSGLRKGENVTVQGMTIGKVTELDLQNDMVVVSCALDQLLELHEDYRIEVLTTSVLGGRQLRIHKGSPDRPLLAQDVELRGELPVDIMAEAGQVVRDVRLALTEGGILDQASEGVAALNLVAGRLARGEGTIGALLSDDTAYRDLVAISADLRVLSAQAREMLAALERGEGTIGQLLRDDAIGNGLRDVIGDVASVTARLRDGQGTLGKLLAEDSALYDDLAQTMSSLRAVAEQVERGDGSLGKLMVDDGLYRRVTALVDEIRSTVDDFRESTPLTTFTSILFGAL